MLIDGSIPLSPYGVSVSRDSKRQVPRVLGRGLTYFSSVLKVNVEDTVEMLPKSRRALTIQEIAALARSSLHGNAGGPRVRLSEGCVMRVEWDWGVSF